MQLIDLALAAAVDGAPLNEPPAAPVAGQCFLVGAAPTGAWTGHAHALAGYTESGWRFVAAIEGMRVVDVASRSIATFIGGSWEFGVLPGPRLAAIAEPGGGSVVDTEARAALAAILSRLRQHGLIAS